jgi:glycosyltransferase involved in cell wall biosynthesis
MFQMKMTALMILQSDFPPDLRVEKEARSLQEGFSVVLLSSNRSNSDSLYHCHRGIKVFRLHHFKKSNAWKRFLIQPFPLNPLWILKSLALIRRFRPRVMHVHDLPLAYLGLVARLLYPVKTVLDLHENYPEALKIWGRKGRFSFLFRNHHLARIYETASIKRFDKIIVVDENHRSEIQGRIPGTVPKIHVVSNAVEHQEYSNMRLQARILQKYRGRFVVCYVGKFSVERGLDTAIQSIPILKKRIPDIHLLLVGDGPNAEDLRSLVIQQDVMRHVEFTGWVDFEQTPSYIQASRVCVVPQPSNKLIDNGIPHKLFQYMSLGRPVVVSDSAAISRVVRETKCGEIFQSHSPKSLADAILKIKDSRFPYGENGRSAVAGKYNWAVAAKELRAVYQQLAG